MEFLSITEESELCKQTEKVDVKDREAFRSVQLAKKIAEFVIDEKGHFNDEAARRLVNDFSIRCNTVFDTLFVLQVKRVIALFLEEKKAQILLRQLHFPLANPFLEDLVRKTLHIEGKELEKKDLAKALFVSLIVPLRQTVGSCFATAPLIHVQINDPLFLLEDLLHLMTKGFLKRVVAGDEMRVPVSIKVGSTNSEVHALLLKCYEYTVASFADWKVDFYKWNMFASLGLDQKEEGGIGEIIYQTSEALFNKAKKELEDLQQVLNAHIEDIATLDRFLQSSYAPDQRDRLGRQIAAKEQYRIQSERDYREKEKELEGLSKLYVTMINEMIRLFPHYFQEVYDPDMQVEEAYMYEDSPSGFRLLFKHGRYDPSLWTMIYEEKEYIESLTSFFQLIEPTLVQTGGLEREAKETIEKIISALLERVQSKGFIKMALQRMKKFHQQHVQGSFAVMPWVYTSGGSVEALMKCYFNLKTEPLVEEFFPKSPYDLLTSLLEFLKDLPPLMTQAFENDPSKGFLMTNSLHVFSLRPGITLFSKAWKSPMNTYTYVRDEIIAPVKKYYEERYLSKQEREQLLQRFDAKFFLPDVTVHKMCQAVFSTRNEKLILEFQEALLNILTDLPNIVSFADTNWSNYFFAFIVSPFTFTLELWLKSSYTLKSIYIWQPLFQEKRWAVYREIKQDKKDDIGFKV